MSFLDFIGFLMSLLLTVYIALKAAKNLSHKNEFIIGQKEDQPSTTFATLAASNIGGGFSLALAGAGATYSLWYLLPLSGYLLKCWLEARYLVPRIKSSEFHDALTIGDILSKKYHQGYVFLFNALNLAFSAGVFAIIVKSGAVIISTVLVKEYASSLGNWAPYASDISVGISFLIVTFYSSIGGYISSVASDRFQFVLLSLFIPLTLIFMFTSSGTIDQQLITSKTSLPLTEMLTLFISFSAGEMLLSPYVSRILGSKDVKSAQKSYKHVIIFTAAWFVVLLLIGTFHKSSGLNDALLVDAVLVNLPVVLKGLALGSLLAIFLSTGDSFLNSSASSLAHDFFKTNDLNRTRLLSLIVAAISIPIALFISSIMSFLLMLYSLWAPVLLPSLVMAILVKNPISTLAVSVGAVLAIILVQFPIAPVPVGVAMLANFACIFLINSFHSKGS